MELKPVDVSQITNIRNHKGKTSSVWTFDSPLGVGVMNGPDPSTRIAISMDTIQDFSVQDPYVVDLRQRCIDAGII